ncbi:MAG: hypothetical protein GY769_20010 [bacterium]|nr:hypothetical protein [bacterium]
MKTKRVNGIETLILDGTDRGSFSVLREWTDRADPLESLEHEANPTSLSIPMLLELAALVETLAEDLAEGPASPKR